MVHAEVHAPIEPPEPEVPLESQIPDGTLDQVGHLPTPKDPVQEESEVLELHQLLIVPDQQVSFQGLINPLDKKTM